MSQWKFSLKLEADSEVSIKKILNLLYRACYEDDRIPPECERFWRIVSLEGERKRKITKSDKGYYTTIVNGVSRLPFKNAFFEFPYSTGSNYSKTLTEDLAFLGIKAEIFEEDEEGNRKFIHIEN